jgi:hypothetical protein
VQWQTTGSRTYLNPLERGDAYPFVLSEVPQTPVKGAYISVNSNAGEIRREMGTSVAQLLESLAKR